MVQVLTRFGLFVGILIFINILSSFVHTQLDLTEEKRFTLTQPTRTMLQSLDNQIYVNVLLEGEFPAGFKRLQDATRAILEDFRSESGLIDYAFEDPSEGTTEEINARRKILSEDGINPVNLRVMDQGETTQKLIYPYATVHLGQRREVIKLLENETPSLNSEEVLNNSVGLLEYKFANALKRLGSESKPMIFFTFGHGELHPLQTAELRKALQPSFDVLDMNLDSLVSIDPKACQLLIVAKPRGPFSEKDKFKIDQYIMQGGKVLWLVDRLNAELDSLAQAGTFLPTDYPLGIEDMLFKYGVRIQPDLVLDLQCSKIPLRVGQMGNAPQLDLFDWYYNVAASPAGSHPICKNLDWTELRFCSSIDTLRTKTPIKKTPLLTSSRYSRLQFMPATLNFEILKYDPDPSKFNKGEQLLAVLLEGVFPSNYQNRVSQEMLTGLKQMGTEFRAESLASAMIVVSDGDVAANGIRDPEKNIFYPLGYNRYENRLYANQNFLINAIEYLTDTDGIIAARTKEVKLRMLDTVRAKAEEGYWRFFNIALPLILLGLFAAGYTFWRRRKYAKMA